MIDAIAVVAALALAEGPAVAPRPSRSDPPAGLGGPGAVSGHGETVMLVRSRTHEVTLASRAGGTLRAACDDGVATVGPGTTTLRAGLPDQAGLRRLAQRIMGLGLEVVDLHLVTAGSW